MGLKLPYKQFGCVMDIFDLKLGRTTRINNNSYSKRLIVCTKIRDLLLYSILKDLKFLLSNMGYINTIFIKH